MDILNLLDLRIFCHLRPERSFQYGAEHALLCHRCAGVYGGFLLAMLLALLLRWNGRWGSKSILFQAALALALIGLSPLHVWLSYLELSPLLDQDWLRFLVGCLAGLGLLQLYLLFSDLKRASGPGLFPSALGFAAAFGLHFLFCARSFAYSTASSLLGILALYAVMNRLVLRSFFPRASPWMIWPLIAAGIAAEWAFLYWYKIGNACPH